MNAETPPRAGRREWIGLAVLALPILLVSLDFGILYLAVPELSADLNPGSAQLLWITDIYGFMIAGFLITMGTLGDRIGRRKLLMIGAAAFAAASLVAAFSTSAEMLIAGRALMGIAGATLMPSTLALITNMFQDPKQRATAIAAWFSMFLAGTVIGPIVGGALLEAFWWGSVFLLGVPVMAVLLVAVPRLLPEYRDPEAGRLDLFSVALSLSALLPVVYGLKDIAQDGVSLLPLAAIAVGVALGIAFVRRQKRLEDPLLDMRLFANRKFSAALAVMLPGALLAGSFSLFAAQYLQFVEGYSPFEAGLWLVPSAIATAIGGMLAPTLAARIGAANVLGAGLLISAAGFAVLLQLDPASGLTVLIAGAILVFFGIAPTGVLGTDMVVGAVPKEKAGSASAVSETNAELGVAVGVAILGSLGTAVYRGRVDDLAPGEAPAGAVESARDSLAGADAAAQDLPGNAGPELLDAAHSAFTSGFTTIAAVGAAAMVAFAVIALTALRNIKLDGDEGIDDSVDPSPGMAEARA